MVARTPTTLAPCTGCRRSLHGVGPMSILTGVDDLIDEWCGLSSAKGVGTRRPLYANKKAAIRLSENQGPLGTGHGTPDTSKLFSEILKCIHSNHRSERHVSETLWVLRKETALDTGSKSAEKILEKVIASSLDPARWYNQVVAASGLAAPNQDRKRSIDLIYERGRSEYDFIELKYQEKKDSHGANNPLYAAWEIVRYGLLYVFARNVVSRQSIANKPLLDPARVKRVHLIVLAPDGYFRYRPRGENYLDYCLEWLEKAINKGLKSLQPGLSIDFTFERFTPVFKELYETPTRLPDAFLAFRENDLQCREPVYGR